MAAGPSASACRSRSWSAWHRSTGHGCSHPGRRGTDPAARAAARGRAHRVGRGDARARARRSRPRRRPGDRLALVGPLGAGKTQLAKGFAVGLGITEVVNSPSFTLMAEYEGRLPLFHQDLYRLAGIGEALAGGLLDERQDDGVTLSEWADRLDAGARPRPADRAHRARGRRATASSSCRGAGDVADALRRGRRGVGRRRERRAHGARPLARPAARPRDRHGDAPQRRRARRRGRRGSVSDVVDVGRRHGAVAARAARRASSPAPAPGLRRCRRIVVGTGPGTFTGLRVGLATAKTLAYVPALPLVGVPSSDALRPRRGRRGRGRHASRRRAARRRPRPLPGARRCDRRRARRAGRARRAALGATPTAASTRRPGGDGRGRGRRPARRGARSPGCPTRCSRSAASGSRRRAGRRRDARARPTSRCRAASRSRPRRWHGRPTSAERCASSRCGSTTSPPSTTSSGHLPRRRGRRTRSARSSRRNRMAHYLVVRVGRRARRLRRHLADGRRGARHDVRGAARRGAAAASAAGCCSSCIELAVDLGARVVTLEVRLSNAAARAALPALRLPARRRPAALLLGQRRGRPDHDHRARSTRADDASAPARAHGRATCGSTTRPTSRAAPDDAPDDGRDDRRRSRRGPAASWPSRPPATRPPWRSWRTAGASSPTSSRARSRSTPRPGGIVPEVAARAHLRWMIPVLEEARERAGVERLVATSTAIAVTEGPGLAGSLLVGITMAKTLAWAHGLPLVPVNHLEGHIYAAWLLDPDEPERPEPEFPLVALVVSGGHTFLVEMRDHLDLPAARPDGRRRGGRGVRQGRPAARPAVSGRAGDHGRGGRRDAPRPALPARLAGRQRRLQLQRPQDRRAPGGRRGAGRRTPIGRAGRLEPARRRGRRARVGVPGLGRRRARDQDPARGRGDRRPDASCSAAAWPPTRVLRDRHRGTAPTAWASRSSCPGRACAPTTPR